MKDLKTYIISDTTDIEDMFLKFLRTILTVELVDNVKYAPELGADNPLVVDIADNAVNRVQNQCPAVFLSVGATRWDETVIDHAAGYAPDESVLYDKEGKLNPVYAGGAKRLLFTGSNPVTIEIRIHGRKPCNRFATRLSKIMYAFASYMENYTNVIYKGGMTVPAPQPIEAIPGAYGTSISLNIMHLTVEDMPQLKDIVHQYFLTQKVEGGNMELYKVIKSSGDKNGN